MYLGKTAFSGLENRAWNRYLLKSFLQLELIVEFLRLVFAGENQKQRGGCLFRRKSVKYKRAGLA